MVSLIRDIYENYLTNREASYVLCSVAKHAGSAGQCTKEVERRTLVWRFSSHLVQFYCRYLPARLILNLTLNQRKKLVKSSGNGQTYYSLADGVTALSQLYALYSDRARSFNQ